MQSFKATRSAKISFDNDGRTSIFTHNALQEEPQVDIMQLLSSLGAAIEQWIVVQSARGAVARREAQEGPLARTDYLTSAPSSPLRLATASFVVEPLSPEKAENHNGRISLLRTADMGPDMLLPAASATLPGENAYSGR